MLKAYNESNSAKTFGTNNNSSLGPNIIVEYDPAVTGISLSSTCKEVNVGWSGYISATVYPASALNKTVYWESSDSNVASINPTSGLICAGLAGNTVITATTADGGFKATCTLTVTYCGGASYQDVTRHNMILQNDGYYRCSVCGYRVKSPILQDPDILSEDDYLKVISCFQAYTNYRALKEILNIITSLIRIIY